MTNLMTALNKLNIELSKKELHIDLLVCGAVAIELNGFARFDETMDIDTYYELQLEIVEIISEIGIKNDLKLDWLNDTVRSVTLPTGAEDRKILINTYSNITLAILSVEDLIQMKVSAWFSRGAITDKDLNDLKLLNPNKFQIEKAIQYTIAAQQILNLPMKQKKAALDILESLKKILNNG